MSWPWSPSPSSCHLGIPDSTAKDTGRPFKFGPQVSDEYSKMVLLTRNPNRPGCPLFYLATSSRLPRAPGPATPGTPLPVRETASPACISGCKGGNEEIDGDLLSRKVVNWPCCLSCGSRTPAVRALLLTSGLHQATSPVTLNGVWGPYLPLPTACPQ